MRLCWLGVVFLTHSCTLVVSAQPLQASVLRGDGEWRENPDCPPDWYRPDTDDSSWRRIDFPWLHVWPRDWPPDPMARPIWGTEAFSANCLRRSFHLDRLPSGVASVRVLVDDDYELYINGQLIGESHDRQAPPPGEQYDATAALHPGENLIALRVIDVGGVMSALISLDLPGVPSPAPATEERLRRLWPWASAAALLGVALALVACTRRLAAALLLRQVRKPIAALAASAAAACLALAILPLYAGVYDQPLVLWNPAATVTAVALLALATACGRLVESPASAVCAGRHVWLAAIFVLAVGLRVAFLDSVPVGFFQDEATNANEALALAERDDWVLWSESVGGRPTLFLYLMSLALKTAGSSYAALKIAPVLIALASLLAVYTLGRSTFGPTVAIWATFLLAVSRWHLHYSRMAWEVICVPLFAALAFALFCSAVTNRSGYWYRALGAGIALAGGLYTYASYRAIVAVFLLFTLAQLTVPGRIHSAKAALLAGLTAIAVAAPLVHLAWTQPQLYWARYNEVSLTAFMRYFDTPLPWIHQFGRSLLSFHGPGDPLVRHNLPGAAHLDPLSGFFLLCGGAVAVWRWRDIGCRLALVWLLAFVALASLTCEGPHATRLFGAIVPAVLLAALGVTVLLEPLRSHPQARAVASAAIATLATAINAYQYFGLEARHPDADYGYDRTGRDLCEMLRRRTTPIDVYWTEDVGFYAREQCAFLAPGRYREAGALHVSDLLPEVAAAALPQERLIVIGAEIIRRNPELQSRDDPTKPAVALPEPTWIATDRGGQPIFFLYHMKESP